MFSTFWTIVLEEIIGVVCWMLMIVELVRVKSVVFMSRLYEAMSFCVSLAIVALIMVVSLNLELIMLRILLVFCAFLFMMLWKIVMPCGVEIPSILRLLKSVFEIVILRKIEGVVLSEKYSVNCVEPWRERVS